MLQENKKPNILSYLPKSPYLIAYFAIFWILWYSKGMTHPTDTGFPLGTVFLISAFIFLLFTLFYKSKKTDVAIWNNNIRIQNNLVLVLLFQFLLFIFANFSSKFNVYAYTKQTSHLLIFNILFYLSFAIFLFAFILRKHQLPLYKILLSIAGLFSISIIYCSIDSGIDTHLFLNMASDYFLELKNPYNYNYPDIYNGKYTELYGDKYYFNYWPASLYICSGFRFLFNDVRYAFVLAQLIFVFILIKYRNQLTLKNAILFSLVWLLNLVVLFVNERSWIDALAVPFFLAALLLLQNKKFLWASILIGFMASIKLYYVFALPFFAIYFLKEKRIKEIFMMGIALITTFMPFLIISFDRFYFSTIVFINSTKIREDSLSMVSAIKRIYAIDASFWGVVIMFIFMGLFMWLFYRSKNNILNLVKYINLSFFAIFLLSKQSFCNYFYFNMLCTFIIFYLEANFDYGEKKQNPKGFGVHI